MTDYKELTNSSKMSMSSEHEETSDGEEQALLASGDIKVYPSRWWQLFLFCVLSMANAFLWITFAPVSNQIQTYYGVSSFAVNGRKRWFITLQ